MDYQTEFGSITFIHDNHLVYEVILPNNNNKNINLKSVIKGYKLHELPDQKLGNLKSELDDYFSGEQVEFSTPTALTEVPPFTEKVQYIIKNLKWGETASYGQIARWAGNPNGARAVGQAMSKNPCPLLVPCHRVIANNNKLGGFSSMIELKKWLLRIEGVNLLEG